VALAVPEAVPGTHEAVRPPDTWGETLGSHLQQAPGWREAWRRDTARGPLGPPRSRGLSGAARLRDPPPPPVPGGAAPSLPSTAKATAERGRPFRPVPGDPSTLGAAGALRRPSPQPRDRRDTETPSRRTAHCVLGGAPATPARVPLYLQKTGGRAGGAETRPAWSPEEALTWPPCLRALGGKQWKPAPRAPWIRGSGPLGLVVQWCTGASGICSLSVSPGSSGLVAQGVRMAFWDF
jgi:hypothetical protein